MFLPGYFGPGIIIDTNMFSDLMQTPGGRFMGITNTGQQLYTAADMPYGLNPSVDIATAMLLGSPTFSGYFMTKFFHALPSDGCIILSVYLFHSTAHLICWAVSSVMKSRWILGRTGR
jgi:hypothetical protein